jgi:hypothetical protein
MEPKTKTKSKVCTKIQNRADSVHYTGDRERERLRKLELKSYSIASIHEGNISILVTVNSLKIWSWILMIGAAVNILKLVFVALYKKMLLRLHISIWSQSESTKMNQESSSNHCFSL